MESVCLFNNHENVCVIVKCSVGAACCTVSPTEDSEVMFSVFFLEFGGLSKLEKKTNSTIRSLTHSLIKLYKFVKM